MNLLADSLKPFGGHLKATILDLRVLVGLCGVVLSIVAHELFHILIHWQDIQSIRIFPDPYAVVEVIIVPTADYDLVVEEAFAYTITLLVFLLTTMLIYEIHDVRSDRGVLHTIFDKDFREYGSDFNELKALEHLGIILDAGK